MSAPTTLPDVPPGRCGSCARWKPTDGHLGVCALGWRAHDEVVFPSYKGIPTSMGHTTAAPELSYHARCMARRDSWTARA